MITALIVTGIGAFSSYYTTLKPINELSENMEGDLSSDTTIGQINIDSLLYDISGIEDAMYQKALIQIIGFLIVVFCLTILASYLMLENLRKKRK